MPGLSIVRDAVREVRRRSPLLFWTGAAHLALAGALLVAMPLDDAVILGVDRLLKPFKFAVSIALYCWTLAWFVPYVESRWARRAIGGVVALCMVVEIALITGQALRGTTSHFNAATPLDAAIFALMGAAIGVNTLMAALLLVFLVARPPRLAPAYLWGLRLGLVLFLLGSAVGGVMVGRGSHTVGAPDGGPGLALVNWSREAGDLRAAHALGLHALQILPLSGFAISRWRATRGRPVGLLLGVAGVYAALTVGLFVQALSGRPLLG